MATTNKQKNERPVVESQGMTAVTVEQDKPKTKRPQVKKPPRFDLATSGGSGLSEYQFPEVGHVFRGGRAAATSWTKMMNYTRIQSTESSVQQPPMKRQKQLTDEETAASSSLSGSNYPKKVCLNGCLGFMQMFVPKGSLQPATVTQSERCTCPVMSYSCPDRVTLFENKSAIKGAVILHINKTYNDFVIEVVETAVDGARNNGTSKVITFYTKKNRVFECLVKKADSPAGMKFDSLEEKESAICSTTNHPGEVSLTPTNDHPVASTAISPDEVSHTIRNDEPDVLTTISTTVLENCAVCASRTETMYRICCSEQCENNLLCEECHNRSLGDRRFLPVTKTNDSQAPDIFVVDTFIVRNQDVESGGKRLKCSFCTGIVSKYYIDGVKMLPQPIGLPYGWIGDKGFFTPEEFEKAKHTYTVLTLPFCQLYSNTMKVLMHLSSRYPVLRKGNTQKAAAKKIDNLHVVRKVCEDQMKPWIDAGWEVPEVPLSADPVDPLSMFDAPTQANIRSYQLWA